MNSSRPPTGGFWITVALIAVLVGYPLSWQPWSYFRSAKSLPDHVCTIGDAAFWPLEWLGKSGILPRFYYNKIIESKIRGIESRIALEIRHHHGPWR